MSRMLAAKIAECQDISLSDELICPRAVGPHIQCSHRMQFQSCQVKIDDLLLNCATSEVIRIRQCLHVGPGAGLGVVGLGFLCDVYDSTSHPHPNVSRFSRVATQVFYPASPLFPCQLWLLEDADEHVLVLL